MSQRNLIRNVSRRSALPFTLSATPELIRNSLDGCVGIVALKSGLGHAVLRFGIFHKGLPYEPAARIFCHEHGDAGIDPHNVVVVPVLQWVESIHETVFAPGLRIG